MKLTPSSPGDVRTLLVGKTIEIINRAAQVLTSSDAGCPEAS